MPENRIATNRLAVVQDSGPANVGHVPLHTRVDKLGASLSLACAIHCLLLPFVIGILPLLGLGFLADHDAEKIFVACSILLATVSLCWGYRTHGKLHVLVILAISTVLVISGFLIIEHNEHVIFLAGGAAGIATAHILNLRLCKNCSHCECHHE